MTTAIETTNKTAIEVLTTEVTQEWLAYEKAEGASDNTLAAYKKGLAIWQQWLQDNGKVGAVILAGDVRQFKVDLSEQYAPQTVNLRLSAVRSFYRFLVNTNRLPFNPASEVKGQKRHKSTTHKRDALTSEEVKCLLDGCDQTTFDGLRDYVIVALMAYCGLREVEIHRADLSNLKTQSDRLVLEVTGKGHTEADAIVVIPRPIERAVRAYAVQRRNYSKNCPALFISLSNRSDGDRLSLRGIRAIVMQRFDACGVIGEKKSTHSLRHTAITTAIRNGATPMQVQAMARHSSFDTTLGYIHEVNRLDNPAEDLITY